MDRCYRFWHTVFAGIVRFLVNIRVINPENEPGKNDGGFMVCVNHLGAADPVLLCAAMRKRQPHFMAKQELFKIPVVSSVIKAWGAYPINRGAGDVGAIRHTIELLHDGKCVGMFPQGTRHRGENPRDTAVKQGVGMICAKTELPVLPVLIRTKNNKYSLFRRVDIIFGELISAEDYAYKKDTSGEFARISRYIFDNVCDLDEKYPCKRRKK